MSADDKILCVQVKNFAILFDEHDEILTWEWPRDVQIHIK